MGLDKLRWLSGLVLFALLWSVAPLASADEAKIERVHAVEEDSRLRIIFDLDNVPEHDVFSLSDPYRVVIDFDQTELATQDLPRAGLLREMRSGVQQSGQLRLVLDMEERVDTRSFVIGQGGEQGHQLLLDLTPDKREAREASRERAQPVRSASERNQDKALIAIDAGHGGVDPGAIGPSGTYEKDVALAVARKLRDLIEQEPSLEPLMIRDGDYYMALRDRTRKAREHEADLFLSLHADGAENPNVKGASVYALSVDGATSERARMLARRENAADFLGGVSLEDKDDDLRSVLVDLTRGATIEASLEVGDYMLTELDRHADLLRNRVDRAGFAVLKSVDMPSLLIELGFMTNAEEERRLNDSGYQSQLADGILAAVKQYAGNYILPEIRQAQEGKREHTVERGDSLSQIARKYQVSTDAIRQANNLSGDQINVGNTLVIP
ncbi:N-acetylmuramoyl-L-alanine amidase [Halorhodospira halochloris]|uniref:N-acetylmuramoyl-L-alanine amidase n=1 Tax=Halorhodospira halochloris TaxID=1052 RepID=UPI001EE94EDD|nr:N-acetylmuramoyl-L-alanine amidase [Halorhodospira halochloris]MCG5548759.1 N-acetylmuramoyl-L-alanine amidase [Halorhodospira halochloris]